VATHFRPRSDSWPDSEDPFPIRAAIQRRVARVVSYFADQANAATGEDWRLVIVCHSQGTMAVLECLNDARVYDSNKKPALEAFESVRLVTMGSPFSHIYQHYFHHLYPSLGDAVRWGTLQANIKSKPGNRWLNVYRVDDYVGRKVEATGLVVNEVVEHFGHTNYWSDGKVMDVLVREKVF
ncbi:MAG TPA: hypothetical protein VD866_23440, partial [Urbifossiella sp.]|nr:hypothetical protein [Urbifossiella sp.]